MTQRRNRMATRVFYAMQTVLIIGMLVGFTAATGSVLVAYAATACAVISGSLGIAYGAANSGEANRG